MTSVDTSKVMRELKRLAVQVPDEVEREVGVGCEHVISAAKHESVVPFKDGHLQKSHGWKKLRRGVWQLYATIVYAAAVHVRHPTRAGWFKQTFMSEMPKALERAAKVVKQRMGM